MCVRRVQVTSAGDPTVLDWDLVGGDPYHSTGVMSGQGLDGALFTVGAGNISYRFIYMSGD